ncbi:MAG: Bro-N domain-containing protein, partial [Enterobacter sichuanensis]|nr:Bro-N domain-containing protein [Enterobacter sichuanensis]
MSELQTFNFEELPVRTLSIDGEPYFVGKDVADILGYSNSRKALLDHVDEEDKLTSRIVTAGQNRNQTIINESGLYSLIFSSKLESAKRFKRWVTSEVLPTLRKTGTYQIPNDPMQALKLMFEATEQTKE